MDEINALRDLLAYPSGAAAVFFLYKVARILLDHEFRLRRVESLLNSEKENRHGLVAETSA